MSVILEKKSDSLKVNSVTVLKTFSLLVLMCFNYTLKKLAEVSNTFIKLNYIFKRLPRYSQNVDFDYIVPKAKKCIITSTAKG